MSDLTSQPWFGWTLVVVIGLPLTLLVLTELHSALVRRGSRLARPVNLLRNWALPAGALLVLVTQAIDISIEVTWVRVLATVFGFLLIVLVLSGLNVAVFGYGERDSWRRRMPSIFASLGRLLLVLVGLGILFAWVWGADVGGLFTALGVTSIVIGLALQNSVGGLISGLLLLFEQPFALGDWLEVSLLRQGPIRGRVVQVNWRAVHLETPQGVHIVPNAMLATSPLTNLSRPPSGTAAIVSVRFAPGDPPDEVIALLEQTARQLPAAPSRPAHVVLKAQGTYDVIVPVRVPSDIDPVLTQYLRWLWYASRRAGLRFDGAGPDELTCPPEQVEQALSSVAGTLRLSSEEVSALAPSTRLERYGDGEVLARAGDAVAGLPFVISGRVALTVPRADGDEVPLSGRLGPGQAVTLATLTGELNRVTATAVGPVSTLQIPMVVVDRLLRDRPQLARELSEAMDTQRRQVAAAIASGPEVLTGQLR